MGKINPRNVLTAAGLVGSAGAIAFLLIGAGHSLLLLATGGTGGDRLTIVRGHWELVALSALAFLAFFALIPIRLKRDWRYHGIYAAFIISLFAEMFGFPLTVYFISSILGFNLFEKEFMLYMYTLGMPLGSFISFLGVMLVILGWREVYRAKESLATSGVYAYLRHPQYVGVLLVTAGWVIHWPTLTGLALFPILAALYVRLARKEDEYLAEKFGEKYAAYAARTPSFFAFKVKVNAPNDI